jgi:hypothetical protein
VFFHCSNRSAWLLTVCLAFLCPASLALGDEDSVKDLTFDNLKFEMEKTELFDREMLTKDIESLSGKKITIRGYIRPGYKQSGITKFVLVRDNQECCFGPGAALYDCVLVILDEDVSVDFSVRPVTVEGEFYIKEFKGPDKKVWAIYRMKNARVKAAQ